jgi:TonB-dependent starch-binding outer membrane protein SusC
MKLNNAIYWLMRITIIQALLAIFFCGVGMAEKNYAQNLLDTKISCRYEKVSLQKALAGIEKKSKIKFAYSSSQIDLNEIVSFNADDKKLREVLELVLAPRGITYQIANGYIVLNKLFVREEFLTPLTLTLSALLAIAPPPFNVTGKVTNVKGESLPGVNIIVKGTVRGTVTDANGNYKLRLTTDDKILVFSFMGMKKQEIEIKGRTIINVVMNEDIAALKEVVINAGYYSTTDRLKTGNITKVSGADLNKSPVSNPLAALQGRVPGMMITQSSGVPGSGFKVEIRGRTQFDKLVSASNDPLYIIDGVPIASGENNINRVSSAITAGLTSGLSPLYSLNMADIESIEVLKDADATAIYGSRGANGVILISTRKGKSGAPRFQFSVSTGASVAPLPDLMSTKQYVAMRKEAFKNDNVAMTTTNAYDLLVWDTLRDNNLVKQLIGKTANTTDAQASVSGGSDLTQFVIGGGYHSETSVYPGNMPNTRGSGHFSVTTRSVDQKFTGTFSGSYASAVNTAPATDLAMKLTLPPNFKLYESDGSLAWNEGGVYVQIDNPLAYLLQKYKAVTTNLNANMALSYRITRNFIIKSSLGYNSIATNELVIKPITSSNPVNRTTGSATFGNSQFKSWIWEPQAEYNKTFGKGQLNALFGGTLQSQKNSGYNFTATGYTSDDFLGTLSGLPASSFINPSSRNTDYKYQAFYGRANYNYDNKYILNLTGRRDGSSRFGPDYRFSNFGAVGAAWLFSGEKFMKQLPFISFAKLRTSYGVTGNDKIGDYNYMALYQSYAFYPTYDNAAAYTPTALFRPELHWEKNTKFEAALELRFLEDRFQFSASWYNDRTSDPLVNYPLPSTTGFTTVADNLKGVLIENQGLELVISSDNIRTKDFIWSTDFNITFPKNKLLKFPNLDQSSYANKYIIGKSLSTVYIARYIGVDPQTGLGTVQDYNNNGVFDGSNYPAGDLYPLFNTDPKYYGGIQNSITYKRFRLDFLLQFTKQMGRSWYNTPYMYNTPFGSAINALTLALDRWQKPGDVTNIQKFITSSGISSSLSGQWATSFSDETYCDASYIRLKNVSLTYDLPTKLVKRAGMQSVRVYMQAQNLFTFSPYLGVDPEISFSSTLAPLRTLILGIQFSL